jgi:eukaryotic-like serine/threonine-protein kinase
MSDHLALHSGALVSNYVLKEPLGQGNFTQTWRAVDNRDGSEVALRVFSNWLSHAPQTRERLEQEVATLQLITHPALVPIACAEFHEGERPSFLATSFIAGASLMRRLASAGTLPPEVALRLMAPVIDAVSALHRCGVVHDNVRPSNIVIDTDSRAHLTDSDLSRVMDIPVSPLPGTYEYMSPERLRGQKTTPAADVYSLGCVFYEILSGMPPFTGSAQEVTRLHAEAPPMPLQTRAPQIPAEMAAVVMQCLEKDPAKRPEDADTLQAALRIERPPARANVTGMHRPPFPRPVNAKRPAWPAVLGAVACGLVLAGWAGFALAPAKAADKARVEQLRHMRQQKQDWSTLPAEQLPAECLGYQPCVDRKQALHPQR